MKNRLALGIAIAITAAAAAAALPKEDGLTALEQNPSSTATEQIASLYRRSQNPNARLWLMDVLYTRVRQYQDTGAMGLLWKASRDRDPGVRHKAINNLDAFRFLPESEGRDMWLRRVQDVIAASKKDSSPAVRAVGLELETTVRNWRAEKARATPVASEPERRVLSARPMALIFLWAVCFQLLGYAWGRTGVGFLLHSKASERVVAKAFDELKKSRLLFIFPLLTIILLLPLLSVSMGWRLIVATIPLPETEVEGLWRIWVVTYLVSGMACFLPTAVMTAKIVSGWKASLKRIPAFIILGIVGLVCWPAEAVIRLTGVKRRREDPFSWMAKVGTPFAVLLACAVMVRDRLWPWDALQRAAKGFAAADKDAGAEFWGRAPFQPFFLLWCLASPALFALSMMPAVWFGFHPSQVFNLWFLSNAQFAIAFGWWAGIIMSAIGLSQLTALGGIRAAQLVSGSSAIENA